MVLKNLYSTPIIYLPVLFSVLCLYWVYQCQINCSRNAVSLRCLEDHSLDTKWDKRPLVVMGILSSGEFRERRDSQRKTWIKTMQKMGKSLPFRIVYNFFLDTNTTESEEENRFHKDMLYLNVPEHGTRNKYGKKVYIILKYIYETYPEAELGIRIDDDVFLCVPQVFERLKKVMSENLYYGWKWHKTGPIDEMFVVLGKNVIKWIAQQALCRSSKCNRKTLKGTDLGSTSLQNWLKRFKDIDLKTENVKINHINIPPDSKDWMKYATPNYCKDHIVFHKVKITTFMKTMHKNNEILKENRLRDVSVSGKVFSGEKVRVSSVYTDFVNNTLARQVDTLHRCSYWAVVTTIFNPSEAIKYVSSLEDWCLVIVADIKTPSEKHFFSNLGSEKKLNTKYLSVDEQLHLYPMLAESIPFSSFARKNIGYMFAIHNKAKLIWDFDDDNFGIISKQGYQRIKDYFSACEDKRTSVPINPYPYFSVTKTRVWPRGFPLDLLKNPNILPKACVQIAKPNLAIIQSLANGEADVDAIYRLTFNPFNFTAKPDIDKIFVLPQNTYAPFNAQATLWFPKAFKYMALPISVTGRVTDIWRSYIAEYFFNKIELKVAFSPPYVFHNRTVHNIMGDFHAETPLYEQSGKLVELLSSNDYNDIVSLYDDLYQRLYIDEDDLEFIRAWDKTFNFVSK